MDLMTKVFALCVLFACSATANGQTEDHVDVCTDKVDILIVVDASGSISEHRYDTLKEKIAELVGRPFGDLEVHYAFIQFGTFVTGVLSFQDQLDPVMVARYFLFYDGQQSYLSRALAQASVYFQPSHGARVDALKYIILFTDGNSALPTQALDEAQNLKSQGIKIIGVGVGDDVNMPGVQAIASEDLAFDGSDLGADSGLCNVIIETVTDYAAGLCTACPKMMDVVIVLDASGSIEESDFDIVASKIANMVSENFGGLDTQYSFITFGSYTGPITFFNYMIDPVIVAGNFLYYIGEHTKIAEGLNLVPEQFRPERGHRSEALRVVLLYTDGVNSDFDGGFVAADAAAQALKDDGIIIFSIAIGNSINMANLETFASPGLTFDGTNYAGMNSVSEAMNDKMNEFVDARCDAAPCATPAKADVLVIIDSSNSITPVDFTEIQRQTANYVGVNGIGGLDTKYAFMSYGYFVVKVSQFNLDIFSPSTVVTHFMFREGQQSRTEEALKCVPDFYTEAMGHRSDAMKIVILITDGVSTNPSLTLTEAENLHESGYSVFAIGVGHQMDVASLQQLSNVETYPVYDIETGLFPAFQLVSSTVETEVTTRCGSPCPDGVDIVIVMDVSATVTEAQFNTVRDTYLPQLMNALWDTSNTSVAFSFITYSTFPTSHYSFKFLKDLESSFFDASVAASLMQYEGQQSLMGMAMDLAKMHLTEEYGARPSALQYVFVFSDFNFDDNQNDLVDFDSAVQELESNGVTVVDFGYGPQVDSSYISSRAATKGFAYLASPLSTMPSHTQTVTDLIEQRVADLCPN